MVLIRSDRKMRHLAGQVICLVCLAAIPAIGDEPGQAAPVNVQSHDASLALPASILDHTWEWLGMQTPKEEITVPDPTSYSLTFGADGAVALQVDCNRGVTSYVLGEDNRITFEPIATTMMMCPEGSLDQVFTTHLERVSSFFEFEGDLLLEQPMDSGTLRFRPAAADADP